MNSILFIQIAESSFDESLMIAKMLSQMDEPVQSVCLCNGLSSSLLASNPDTIVGVLTENQEDNLSRFQQLIAQMPPRAIVVLDLYKFFLNPMELNFLPVWLEDLTIPILAMDYFNLMVSHEGQIKLNDNIKLSHLEAGETADNLDLPMFLLKPVPPVLPEPAERTFYWNPIDTGLLSSAPQLRQQVLDSLAEPGIKPTSSQEPVIITVYFDPSLFTQAFENQIIGFYFVLIEVLIYYMRQFPEQYFQLLIVGSAAPSDQTSQIDHPNFEVHYFSHLTEDNYRTLLAASDLFVSNTNWSPALLDAATLGTPAFVFGNSVILEFSEAVEGQKELKSFFQAAPELYNLSLLLCDLNIFGLGVPIFPFINYPFKHPDIDFPNPGLQAHALPHFLIDMFDDQTSLPLLKDMLFSPLYRKEYFEYCQATLQIANQGLNFQQIIEKVNS